MVSLVVGAFLVMVAALVAGAAVAAKFSDDAKITVLVKENPRRKGTVAYEKFSKFKSGMTVGEFIKAGERHEDWDMRGIIGTALARGQISVK
ncbi:MAG: hypothetical protein WDM89_06005 [Rhizomicrobium sp.]